MLPEQEESTGNNNNNHIDIKYWRTLENIHN